MGFGRSPSNTNRLIIRVVRSTAFRRNGAPCDLTVFASAGTGKSRDCERLSAHRRDSVCQRRARSSRGPGGAQIQVPAHALPNSRERGKFSRLEECVMVDMVRVLFPTDFSDASAQAGKYAFSLADRLGAELHALHVVEAIAPTVPEALQRLAAFQEDYLKKARDDAAAALAAALPNDLAGGKKVVRAIRVGAPLGSILEYAKENGVDLIVMGTYGRTGLPHVLIGSVTERVVRHAPCPVLTVPPPRR